MKTWNKTKQWGFTLIELGMVIVILGILAAIAIPKYVDLSTEATDAAKNAMVGDVKSALAITVVDMETYPTYSQLAANIQGATANISDPAAVGFDVNIDGTIYFIPLYSDFACTTDATTTSSVLCVGNIS